MTTQRFGRARLTADKLSQVFDKTGGDCSHCGKQLSWNNYGVPGARGAWEVDHIHHVSSGGGNNLVNLRPMCVDDNRARGDHILVRGYTRGGGSDFSGGFDFDGIGIRFLFASWGVLILTLLGYLGLGWGHWVLLIGIALGAVILLAGYALMSNVAGFGASLLGLSIFVLALLIQIPIAGWATVVAVPALGTFIAVKVA